MNLMKLRAALICKRDELAGVTEDDGGNEVPPEVAPAGVEDYEFAQLLTWFDQMIAWTRELDDTAKKAAAQLD
jgi:hypothetical protein